MRRDDPVGVGAGSEKPDYDVVVPELRIKYFIGPKGNPDEVVLAWAVGEYVVDQAMRDEIALITASVRKQTFVEHDAKERHFALMGPFWYEFLNWFINQSGGAVVGYMIGQGIDELKEKLRPRTRQFDSPIFNAEERGAATPQVEQLALSQARTEIVGNFDVNGELTQQAVTISRMPKAGNFSATVVFRDSAGSVFTAALEWDNGFRKMRITRSYANP